jgi:hypothetical protein
VFVSARALPVLQFVVEQQLVVYVVLLNCSAEITVPAMHAIPGGMQK